MYRDYHVQGAVVQTVKKALADMGIEGFTVIPRNQPTMTAGGSPGFNLDRSNILVDILSHRRNGWQSHRYITEERGDGTVVRVKREEWLDTWTIQLSGVTQRNIDDTGNTVTAYDALSMVQIWLNSSEGAKYMRNREKVPFAPYWIFDVRRHAYRDDSHINQIEASLDFKINLVQFIDSDPIFITDWEVETHPI